MSFPAFSTPGEAARGKFVSSFESSSALGSDIDTSKLVGEAVFESSHFEGCVHVYELRTLPDAEVDDCRMMPLFVQPSTTTAASSLDAPMEGDNGTDSGTHVTGESEELGVSAPASGHGGLAFDDNMLYQKAFGVVSPHSYGTMAQVDPETYHFGYNYDIDPSTRVPLYRIYVDVIRPRPFFSTLVWLLTTPRIERLSETHLVLLVKHKEANRITHWDRLYMWQIDSPSNGSFWTVSDVGRREDGQAYVSLTNGDEAGPDDARGGSIDAFVRPDADSGKARKAAYEDEHEKIRLGTLVFGLVMSSSESEADVQNDILKLLSPEDKFPARLCGISGEHQPAQFMTMLSLFSVAVVLNGPATLVVQPEFWLYEWRPGDLIYMKLAPLDGATSKSLQRYEINYVPGTERRKGENEAVYAPIGVYIEKYDDADVHCCRIAASDCPSAVFT